MYLQETIERRVIQNLFYNLSEEFKAHSSNFKVRVRLKNSILFSDWFYPWFLLGGYGKLETHKAICTKRSNQYNKFDRDNLSTGLIYKFADIYEFEISNDYSFREIGSKAFTRLKRGVVFLVK